MTLRRGLVDIFPPFASIDRGSRRRRRCRAFAKAAKLIGCLAIRTRLFRKQLAIR